MRASSQRREAVSVPQFKCLYGNSLRLFFARQSAGRRQVLPMIATATLRDIPLRVAFESPLRFRGPVSVTSVPSAQVSADGRPRFHLAAPDDRTGWDNAVAAEAAGGVLAEIRIFLDAQLEQGDVFVDFAPGFGFVALGAVTAPGGMPAVLISGLTASRFAQLEGCALDVGASIESAPSEASALEALVESRLGEQGRLFVHATGAQLSQVIESCRRFAGDGRLVAICLGDAHEDAAWPATSDALAAIGFEGAVIVEQKGQAILVPLDGAPTAPVIALPGSVLRAG